MLHGAHTRNSNIDLMYAVLYNKGLEIWQMKWMLQKKFLTVFECSWLFWMFFDEYFKASKHIYFKTHRNIYLQRN